MRLPFRTTAALGSACLLTFGLAACGTGEKEPGDYSTSVPTKSYAPGSLTSTNLEMVAPTTRGGAAIVTGTLLNSGEAGFITSADTNVAKKIKLFNGSEVVKEIPVAAEGAAPSQELTKTGFHLELEDVKMVIDNDGKITLELVTDGEFVSEIEVVVKKKSSASPTATATPSVSAAPSQ